LLSISPRLRFDGTIVERTIACGQTQIELLSAHSMEMTSETTLEGWKTTPASSCTARTRIKLGSALTILFRSLAEKLETSTFCRACGMEPIKQKCQHEKEEGMSCCKPNKAS